MPYFRRKLSLNQQICTIKMKMTKSLEAAANMSTLKTHQAPQILW